MKILITGGLGFIGSNLVAYLLKKKKISQILIVDNLSKSSVKYLESITKFKFFNNIKDYKKSKSRVVVVKANVIDFKIANIPTKNIDSIVHLAAESGIDISISNPRESFETNVIGTFNYLESARLNNVKSFIFASSGSVFGDVKPPMIESYPRIPIAPYGSSKLSIESYCETYSKVFNIKTTILRFSNAYGLYSSHKKSVVANFIKSILDNQPIIINGDGKHTRDYVFAEDLVDAIYKSIFKKDKNNIFHISTGIETTTNKLLSILKKISYKYKLNIPNIKNISSRVGDMRFNSLSTKHTEKNLRWKHKISIDNGVERTLKWFLKSYN